MADQTIALQARAPQGNSMAAAIRQNSQLMNMMTQQAAAQRQTQQAQQAMDIARNQETRNAALAVPQLDEARSKAFSAEQKTILEFFDLAAAGMKTARGPEDARKIGDFLKNEFNGTALVGIVDQTLSSLPDDPNLFQPWRMQTLNQSLDTKSQLEQEFTTQNLGTSTRVLATPKFAGSPGGGASRVVPGSEAQVNLKPTVVNVEGIGAVIVDPNTGKGYPAAVGTTGGYTPPGAKNDGGGIPAGRGGAASALVTNPGALKDGPFAKSQPGYTGAQSGFATFDTPQAGVAAQENLLRGSYIDRGFNTINKIVDRYAPQGPENSAASVNNYKQYIAQRTGIDINAPVNAGQVPVVAAAMREFETGQRPGASAPGRAPAPSMETTEQVASRQKRQSAARSFFETAGIDPSSGKDPVADLIKQSTSGFVERVSAGIVGAIPSSVGGGATKGSKAIGELETIRAKLTFDLLNGKLGAGISNEDRIMVQALLGDIANPDVPSDKRLAAWSRVKQIQAKYLGINISSGGAGAGQRQVTRTGKTGDGRTVTQYSDGSIEYGR